MYDDEDDDNHGDGDDDDYDMLYVICMLFCVGTLVTRECCKLQVVVNGLPAGC